MILLGCAVEEKTMVHKRQAKRPTCVHVQCIQWAATQRDPVWLCACAAGEVVYLPQLEGNKLGRGLLWLVGAYGKKQQLRNGASVLYQGITEAAENPELQQGV